MRIGYIRVSTLEQNTARQDELMKRLKVEKTYTDKASGKNADRPQLKEMLAFVREGDTVVVESISRFARNTKDLLDLLEQLNQKKVQFVSQKEQFDTATPQGRFTLYIFAALAELERETTHQRQMEGIAIAKAEGKYTGRPRKRLEGWETVYEDYNKGILTAAAASRKLSVSRSTFYRRCEALEREEKRQDKIV